MAKLQQGIHWDHGQVPPRHFAIVFLRIVGRPGAADVDLVLSELTDMWRGLSSGKVPQLPGATVPASGLTFLLAFGRKAFETKGASRSAPRGLTRQDNRLPFRVHRRFRTRNCGFWLPGDGILRPD